MNVNYEYYRIFYHVARCKSLTQAAEVLHASQPNLSRAIRLLEGETGCRLMLRSNRGVTLTPEGERLYSHVKIAVERLMLAEEEIAAQTSLRDGCVTIGASETALRILVLPVLRVFRETYPGIRIRIRNHLTIQAVRSVEEGKADFAVVTTPPPVSSVLKVQPLTGFRDVLTAGPSLADRKDGIVTLKETASWPLICLGEDTVTYRFYEEFYRKHGLILRPELLAATADQMLPLIKDDLGIGFVPEIFVRDALAAGEVYRLTLAEELPFRPICLVEHEGHPLNVAAAALKEMLVRKAADHDSLRLL